MGVNKKFILKISLIAIITVAGFWFVFKKSVKKEIVYQKKSELAEKRNEFLNKDTDNDGLKDWEENLYGTDLDNKDTDNDKTSDFEEIKLNRNPLKPFPNDNLPKNIYANATSSETPTLTQKIGREFLTQYFSVKGDEKLTQTERLNLINSLLTNINSDTGRIKYEIGDISVSNDNSEIKIKNYINGFARTIKPIELIQENELQILAKILSNEEEELSDKIKSLKTSRLIYEKTVRDLTSLSVPSNYKYIHLDFLNFFNNTAISVSKLEMVYEDPAKSMIGLKEYAAEAEKITTIFKTFKNQTIKDRIIFSEKEDGYILSKDYFSKI